MRYYHKKANFKINMKLKRREFPLLLSALTLFQNNRRPRKIQVLMFVLIFHYIVILILLQQGKLKWLYSHTKKIKTPRDIGRPWNSTVNCCYGFPKRNEKFPKFNECAFVTSSGHLLGSGAGDEIDRHEAVIRTNDSPTTGYEKDVGNNTTLRYIAPMGAKKIAKNPGLLLNSTSKPKILIFHATTKHVLVTAEEIHRLYPEIKIFLLNYRGHNELKKTIHHFGTIINPTRDSRAMPSGGIKAIVIAMQMCKKVTVYGISPPHHCRDVKFNRTKDVYYHYYDPPPKNNLSHYGQKECFNYNMWETKTTGHHDPTLEKYIYAVWLKEGANLAFHFPHWTYQNLVNDTVFQQFYMRNNDTNISKKVNVTLR